MHGIEFIECLQIGIHGFHVLPGGRHNHANGTEQIHATGNQQLEHVVHARGVGAGYVDDRRDAFQIRQHLVGKFIAPGMRPVAVGSDGINFTIVRDQPERLGQRPLGQRVGGEPLVEHADSGFHALIAQIREELPQIGGHHQAFIGDDLVRQAANVKILVGLHGDFGLAAGVEQLDAELLLIQPFTGHKHLLNTRHAAQRQRAQHAAVERHFAPANQRQTLIYKRSFESLTSSGRSRLIDAHKHHTHSILLRELGTQRLFGNRTQKPVGLLNQQATTVTGLAVGVDATTVCHACQGFNGRQ